MSKRKKVVKPMARRKNEFSRALQAAKSELKSKTVQRDRAMKQLRELNVDIPNLERTVRALEAQLGGTGHVSRPTSQADNNQVGVVPPYSVTPDAYGRYEFKTSSEIPPEILAKLPPEDLSKFRSHFGSEPAAEEDALPTITGKPV